MHRQSTHYISDVIMASTTHSKGRRIDHVDTKYITDAESPVSEKVTKQRPRTGVFTKSLLDEIAYILPLIPVYDDHEEIKKFICDNLRYSAEYSRLRVSRFIVQRIFPSESVNPAIRLFAKKFSGRQELRDVIFYMFLKAEPLMEQIINDLFVPAMNSGSIRRSIVNEYLEEKFPNMKSARYCSRAAAQALKETKLAKTTQDSISLAYRSPLIFSFGYILHNEFPRPGIHPIKDLENNSTVRAMFWYPEAILPMLYELRNQGIISRVSEIDTVRQFSTKYTLDEYVAQVAG